MKPAKITYIKLNDIPAMVDPLGAHWSQPQREEIEFKNGAAYMSQATFNKLAVYSTTLPTGVYEGKMWRRQANNGRWYLNWFMASPDPNKCRVGELPITVRVKWAVPKLEGV